MAKQPTSFRLSDMTTRQLAELIAVTGLTQSEVMSTAIDRMYQQEIKTMNTIQTDAQFAAKRVDDTPALQPYKDILIDYEWDNQDEHLSWVVTADTAEILSWCKTIDRDNPNNS